MVGKIIVQLWNSYLRHVAGHAIALAHGTRAPRVIRHGLRVPAQYMTSKAFHIVRLRVSNQLVMRIVARKAGDSLIALSPALAILKPVGWRADCGNARTAAELDIPPRGVTRAAEINSVRRRQPFRIED